MRKGFCPATLEVVLSEMKSQSSVFDNVHPQPKDLSIGAGFGKFQLRQISHSLKSIRATDCKKPTIADLRKNIKGIYHISYFLSEW